MHRDGRADDGAEREEERDDEAHDGEELGESLRLGGEEVWLALDLEAEPLVGLDDGAEGVDAAGRGEAGADDRDAALPAEGGANRDHVGPDLRLGARAAIFEDTDDAERPVLAHGDLVAERQPLEAAEDAAAHHGLVGARLGQRALHHLEVGTELERLFAVAAHVDVGEAHGTELVECHDDEELAAADGLAVLLREAWLREHEPDGSLVYTALEFAGCAGPHDDGDIVLSADRDRLLDAGSEHERSGEDGGDEGYAEHGDDGGDPADPDAAKVVLVGNHAAPRPRGGGFRPRSNAQP